MQRCTLNCINIPRVQIRGRDKRVFKIPRVDLIIIGTVANLVNRLRATVNTLCSVRIVRTVVTKCIP